MIIIGTYSKETVTVKRRKKTHGIYYSIVSGDSMLWLRPITTHGYMTHTHDVGTSYPCMLLFNFFISRVTSCLSARFSNYTIWSMTCDLTRVILLPTATILIPM